MHSRSNACWKIRPVAHEDWGRFVDKALRVLMAKPDQDYLTIHQGLLQIMALLPAHDFASFAKAIQTKPLHTAHRAGPLPKQIQLGPNTNDASLKHARRRIRLAKDFDEMLVKGFPTLSLNQSEPDLTLYISLTPTIAENPQTFLDLFRPTS
ncbi:hypothetical protein DSO57_1013071 [Entomophthora muscae]|uniref:Uncharacterized protein n=1 Tax=Entomophthora muscae TaxID=34485 RepID=A0ACC2SIT2_9FUNG|nr:hypothetical protein DSO57_1013071 [Entomophthora muscae]